MKSTTLTIAAVALAWSAARAQAGMVELANLPAGSAIVEIDSRADGSATYGGATPPGVLGANQDDWFQPFNTGGNLLTYTVQPGTYTFRVINQADAAILLPSLTPDQLNRIGTGSWTYNSPWATDYLVFRATAANDPAEHQLFTGSVVPGSAVPGSTGFNGGGYDTADEAYAAAKLGGYDDVIVTGTGRYTGTPETSYTFAAAQTLIFAVPDNILDDNTGTISVLISAAADATSVPEPSSGIAMGIALAILAVGPLWRLGR